MKAKEKRVWDPNKKKYVIDKEKKKPVKWIHKNQYVILENGTIEKGINHPYRKDQT